MANTKIPVELSSTPGIVDNSNATAITIDSSENVGIGRTPTAYGSFKVLDLAGSSGAIQKLIHTGSTVELQSYASSTVGAVGTATSHPLLFTTGDAERMRIDSSGNLLVGKTTTAVTTGCDMRPTGNIVASASADNPLYLNRSTSDGDIAVFAKDGSPVGSIGGGATFLTIGSGTGNVYFQNGVMAPTASSAGASSNGVIDLGTSSSKFKDLYLSGNVKVDAGQGIHFGGAAGASGMTSQVLDDYEEGTFTPVFTTDGTDFTQSSVGSGTYTKVGRLVTVQINCVLSGTVSGGTGDVLVTGLPFTVSVEGGYGAFAPGRITVTESLGAYVVVLLGTTTANVQFIQSGALSSKLAASDINGNGTPFFSTTITYQTS